MTIQRRSCSLSEEWSRGHDVEILDSRHTIFPRQKVGCFHHVTGSCVLLASGRVAGFRAIVIIKLLLKFSIPLCKWVGVCLHDI